MANNAPNGSVLDKIGHLVVPPIATRNIEGWINGVEAQLRATGDLQTATDANSTLLLLTRMERNAADAIYCKGLLANPPQSWDALKEALRTAWGGDACDDRFVEDMLALRQRYDEPMDDYIKRFLALVAYTDVGHTTLASDQQGNAPDPNVARLFRFVRGASSRASTTPTWRTDCAPATPPPSRRYTSPLDATVVHG